MIDASDVERYEKDSSQLKEGILKNDSSSGLWELAEEPK